MAMDNSPFIDDKSCFPIKNPIYTGDFQRENEQFTLETSWVCHGSLTAGHPLSGSNSLRNCASAWAKLGVPKTGHLGINYYKQLLKSMG
jgi:hypothetical protein